MFDSFYETPKSHQQPTKILENNCEITDTNLIANAFNRYFTNIAIKYQIRYWKCKNHHWII